MSRRYSALGFIAGLYQIAGVVVTALGALALALAIAAIVIPSRGYGAGYYAPLLLGALAPAVAGLLSGIGLYAIGELINLFRDMELNARLSAENSAMTAENTERMVALLEHLSARRRQQPPANPNPPSPARSGNPQKPPPPLSPTEGDIMRHTGVEG